MPATTSDLFSLASSGTAPLSSTLTAAKAIGAPSFAVAAASGWPTSTLFHFKLYQATAVNGVSTVTPGTETLWSGIITGLSIGSLTLRSGNDQVYPINSIIEPMLTSAQYDNLINGLLTQHNQNGTHGAITATSLATSAAATVGTTLGVTGATNLGGGVAVTGAASVSGVLTPSGGVATNTVAPVALKMPYALRAFAPSDFVGPVNTWSTVYIPNSEYSNGFTFDGGNGWTVNNSGIYLVSLNITHQDSPNTGFGAGAIVAGMATSATATAPTQPGWYQRTGFVYNPCCLSISRTFNLAAGTHVFLQSYAGGSTGNYRLRSGNASDGTTLELVYLGPSS